MTRRGRYILLGVFGGIGAVLAWGAWDQSPDHDPDNQGGYAIVLLLVLVLMLVYVPIGMRWVAGSFRRRSGLRADGEMRGEDGGRGS